MNHRTHGVLAAGLLLAASAGLAGCGSSSTSPAAADKPASSGSASTGGTPSLGAINVQLSWIKNSEFAGEFEADSKGFFKDAGFSGVTLTPGPTTTEALVASGKATFGLSDAVATASAITKSHAPIKIVGSIYQKNPFSVISLADKANITKPQDLVGKTIGVQTGGNVTLFNALLAANGIDPKSVKVVPTGYDPSVLWSGNNPLDGYFGYLTNESILVKDAGKQDAELPLADNGLPFVADSIITTTAEIKDHPDVVKGFLKAELQGWKAACANPEEGADLAVNTYGKGLKPALEKDKELAQAQAECTELITTDETKANGLFTISPAMAEANIKTLAEAKISITADQLFDTSLLTQVLSENPDLK